MPEKHPRQDESAWQLIKQHKVVQWTAAYGAVAFALLGGLDIVATTFDWPRWAMRSTTVLMIVGAPVVALLAWYHGHQRLRRVTRTELVLLTVLLGAGGAALWWVGGAPAEHDAASTTAQSAGVASFAPPPHSVAVLAFANVSGNKDDEYFSDGLSEELLNTLARVNELQVAARASSFSFKGTSTDIQTVGRKLNVGAVLEGSVRREGGRVRIAAGLANAVTGFNLWSETFDRDLEDVFALQTEIATAVTTALKTKLLGTDMNRLAAGGTRNAQALDLYLRGLQASRSGLEEDKRAALKDFDEAIALDPNFALAHAQRGFALSALYNAWLSDPAERRRAAADALSAAKRAIQLAPDAAEGYLSLSWVLTSTTIDFAGVESAARHAMELEPGNARALRAYVLAAASLNRPDVFGVLDRALILDPLDPGIYMTRALVFMNARRFGEARAAGRQLLAVSTDPQDRCVVGYIELAAGKAAEVLPYCEPHLGLWLSQSVLAVAYHRLGRTSDALEMVRLMQARQGEALAYNYAGIYSQWGQPKEALEWLEKAYRLEDPGLLSIQEDFQMDPIRDRPEFQAIVAKLNFPQPARAALQ